MAPVLAVKALSRGPDRSEAVRRLLDATPIHVSDWSLMKDEIDQMYESITG